MSGFTEKDTIDRFAGKKLAVSSRSPSTARAFRPSSATC